MPPSPIALPLIAVACLLAGAARAADELPPHTGKPPLHRTPEAADKAAADKPAEKVAADKVLPKAADKPAERGVAKGPMSMDDLRERLAQRLGTVKAPDARSPYVLHVANKAPSATEPTAAQRAAAVRAQRPSPAAAPALATHEPHEPHEPAHEIHWAYEGAGGPESWAHLKPEYATCATGQRQSPIDIRDGLPLELEPIAFDYHPSAFSVIDNGHTVQVNLAPGNALRIGERRYELLQFHFHRPSEERLNGRQFDMVAHLVHKADDGRLAVVAVLLERGSANPLVQAVWNALPLEKGQAEPASGTLDLAALLPQDRRYVTYMGSLTTPPCTEGVQWLVMKQPVPLSPQQIGIFARLYPMNARPLQSASGRLIKDGQ